MSGAQHGSLRFLPRSDQLAGGGGSSPWTITSDVIHPIDLTDSVAIGASATVGSEILRVVGDSRFEGDVLIDPALRIEDPGGSAGYIEMTDGSAAGVSAAGVGRLRYNESTNKWQISENGAGYVDITGGGSPWTDTGTLLHPATVSRAVVVGASAAAGNEIFRVTAGATLIDGATGGVPLSGVGTRLMWVPAFAALRAGAVTGSAWDTVGTHSAALNRDTVATGTESLAVGDASEALAAHSVALGQQAQSPRIGQLALSNGAFAAAGDAQGIFIALRRVTTDNTGTDLTIDGAAPAGVSITTSNRLTLEDDTTYGFQVRVVARNTATSESKHWTLEGTIKRDSGAATVALVGGGFVTKQVINFDAGADTWDVNALADTTNGALRIVASGQAGKTIRWSATAQWTEVAV